MAQVPVTQPQLLSSGVQGQVITNENLAPPVIPVPQPQLDTLPQPFELNQAPPTSVLPPPPSQGMPQPVIQEVRTFKTSYPVGSAMNPLSGVGGGKPRGVQSHNTSTVAWLNHVATLPDSSNFRIEIVRRLPAMTPDGQKLKQGTIYKIAPVMPYSDVYDTVEQLFGGGDYSLMVLNLDGQPVHQCKFSVEGPPNFTEQDDEASRGYLANRNRVGFGLGSANQMSTYRRPFTYADNQGPETEEIVKAHQSERAAMARASQLEAETKLHQAVARYDKTVNADTYERVEKAKQDRDHAQKIEEKKIEEGAKKEEREHSFTEKLLFALLAKDAGKENGNGNSQMMVFMESMKLMMAQSQQSADTQFKLLTTILTPLLAKPSGSNETIEAFKMIQSSQQKALELVHGNNRNEDYNKLVQLLISDSMKNKDEIGKLMQTVDIIDKLRGDRDDGDWLNPDGSFLGNLGNAILSGLKGLISGGARGGGAAILDILNSKLGKPSGNSQFSDSDLIPIASALERQKLALPAPTISPQQDVRAKFDSEMEFSPGVLISPVARPSPVSSGPSKMPPVVFVSDPINGPVNGSTNHLSSIPQQVIQEVGPVAILEEVEEDVPLTPEETLRELVDETIEIMFDDITAGRIEHEWSEFAYNKWNKSFKDSLAQAEDDAARLKLIKEKASPEVFNKLYSILLNQNNWQAYQHWINALHSLLSDHMKGINNAA